MTFQVVVSRFGHREFCLRERTVEAMLFQKHAGPLAHILPGGGMSQTPETMCRGSENEASS